MKYAQRMNVVIRFRYSICAKSLIAGGIITSTAHTYAVSITNVPEGRWSSEEQDASILWQAENKFLKYVKETHLESALVEWEASDSEGKKLSQFWFNHVAMR